MNPIRKNGRLIGKYERRGNRAMTECYFCKGRVVQQKIKVDFRWGRRLKVIENVPAGVCQQCGEKYLTAEVAKKIEHSIKTKKIWDKTIAVPVEVFTEGVAV